VASALWALSGERGRNRLACWVYVGVVVLKRTVLRYFSLLSDGISRRPGWVRLGRRWHRCPHGLGTILQRCPYIRLDADCYHFEDIHQVSVGETMPDSRLALSGAEQYIRRRSYGIGNP